VLSIGDPDRVQKGARACFGIEAMFLRRYGLYPHRMDPMFDADRQGVELVGAIEFSNHGIRFGSKILSTTILREVALAHRWRA